MTAERQADLESQMLNGTIEPQDLTELLVEAYGQTPENAALMSEPKGRFVDDDGRACYA